MDKNTTLHFFCGKMAAGKSTLAKHLSEKYNAILLGRRQLAFSTLSRGNS